MRLLKLLIFKPTAFFKETEKLKTLRFRNVILWGLIVGIVSQFVPFLFLVYSFYSARNSLLSADPGISIEFKAVDLYPFLYLFAVIVILIPIITILLRNVLGWVTLKIVRVKEAGWREINIIVCFGMIANLWNIIPLIGFFFAFIHLFLLSFIAARNFYEIRGWKSSVFAFIVSLISFQPFMYTMVIV